MEGYRLRGTRLFALAAIALSLKELYRISNILASKFGVLIKISEPRTLTGGRGERGLNIQMVRPLGIPWRYLMMGAPACDWERF